MVGQHLGKGPVVVGAGGDPPSKSFTASVGAPTPALQPHAIDELPVGPGPARGNWFVAWPLAETQAVLALLSTAISGREVASL